MEISMRIGYVLIYVILMLAATYLFGVAELSEIPALKSILFCMPDDVYVTLFYKMVLLINIFMPISIVVYLEPSTMDG
jgi:hypothetical protein